MSDVRAAVIGGVIAAVGLLGGKWVEKWLDRNNFEHTFVIQSRSDLVAKRFQLISDFSSQINSVDYVKILHGWNESVAQIGPLAVDLCQSSSNNEVEAFNCIHEKIMVNSLKYRGDISERNSKFVSTLQMSRLLFGPKVSNSINEISKDNWWSTEESRYIAILEAMRDEIYHFD